MRILLAPGEIAGYMGRLKDGLVQLGQEVKFVNFTQNSMKYSGGEDFPSVMAYRRLAGALSGLPSWLRAGLETPIRFAVKLCLFVYSLFWADAVIFCFGRTLLGGSEVPIYRLFRKKTIMIYLGSDSRPPYLNGYVATKEQGIPIGECKRLARSKKRKVSWFDRHIDIVVDHVPCGHFHEKAFVPFLAVGMPAPSVPPDSCGAEPGAGVKILHAPSFPEAKGTPAIREAIGKLKSEGYAIDYLELTGRPNAEVLKEIGRCSFIVDELYSDSVLAGLGTEAAIQGKATIVGSYARDGDFGVSVDMIPPAIRTRPEEFEKTLRETIDGRTYFGVGEAARDFVSAKWKAVDVAGRYLRLLQEGPGVLGLTSPADVKYLHGWGFPSDRLKAYLRRFLELFGPEALQLRDKPALRDAIVDFSREDSDV